MNNIIAVADSSGGLSLSGMCGNGVDLSGVGLRVRLAGQDSFHVWGVGDKASLAPAWSEPDLSLTFFDGAATGVGTTSLSAVSGETVAWRAEARHKRAVVTLGIRPCGERLAFDLAVTCPPGQRPLPMCSLELALENLTVGSDGVFETAHHYGGGVHGLGRIDELTARGHAFAHGCLGLALPLVYLHNSADTAGLELEFLVDGRPFAWLRRGRDDRRATFAVAWETDRLLEPGQTHTCGGTISLRPYEGRCVEQVRRYARQVGEHHGLAAPPLPDWARNANIVEYDMLQPPARATRGLTDVRRGDDPRFDGLLSQWRDMGFNVLYLIAPNNTHRHSLSPLDYQPSVRIGGHAGEKRLLDRAHEAGFRVVLWATTVGLDMDSPLIKEHRDAWVAKPDGNIFCPFGDYAADADPQSAFWRAWLTRELADVLARGYDGLFIDGLVPRGSNHMRWSWPGQCRNGVQEQVVALARDLRAEKPDVLMFIEDENVLMQAAGGFTVGRYQPSGPKLKRYWAGIGMPMAPDHPSDIRIAPEQVRDYLAMRYASLLPGTVSCDMIEGYYSDACRPWTAQSLLAGCSLKTFSTSVGEPEIFEFVHDNGMPPETERSADHRRRGHEEFCSLLRLVRDEPLIRHEPLSIEGVRVEGDAAVVGLLHATAGRAVLALVQFADRDATVTVRLAEPTDLSPTDAKSADQPHIKRWQIRELLRGFTEINAQKTGELSPDNPLTVNLGRYGFRVLELRS
ncbi:MAG: hypothetical protein FWE88_08955 [Phycisphaerae bacterium]|nr:hypothetical protein [Phycisphaerae bacterium]